jgi:polysaccharide pyruvyl transferase WcaK-like protein
VVISNVFSDRNRGGAAITEATVEAALRVLPGAEVVVIPVERDADLDRSHPVTRERFPDARFLVPPLSGSGGAIGRVLRSLVVLARGRRTSSPALRAIAEADAVISKGGHVYVSRPSWGSLLGLWSTAFPIVYAARVGTPTVLYSHSLGPYADRRSRALNRAILRRVDAILVRDHRSREAAMGLGGIDEARIRVMPDSAFGLDPPTAAEVESTLATAGLHTGRFVAVSVRAFAGEAASEHLLEEISALLTDLLEDGWVDRAVLVVQSLDDVPATCTVADRVGPRALVWGLDERCGPRDLLGLYAAARVTIAARMHGAILSLAAGTPAIGIATAGRKVEGVFESLGLGHLVVRYEQVDRSSLRALLEEATTASTRASVLGAVADARSRARSADVAMRDALRP